MAYIKMIPYIASPGPGGLTGTYTVNLNLNDSDPTTWATYADDAVGMEAGSDDWDSFFGHYPCILENGVELGKLKRNNFAQYENGTSAPITTLGKDVMICFPRRGIKIEYLDANTLSVSMTDEDNKSGYSYMAHSYKSNVCDKFYLGVYKGYQSSNKLYSTSGQIPVVSQTVGTYRGWAQARGTNYEQSAWFQLIFRQAMYLLKYKGQNAQVVIGRGLSDYSGIFGNTGYTNDKGMDWGESTGKYPMCLFGLEDFYGNIYDFIDGVSTDENFKIYVSDGNFNNTHTGYIDTGIISPNRAEDTFLTKPIGTNLTGFLPANTDGGSGITYFCDKVGTNSSRAAAIHGGMWNNNNNVGVFQLYLWRTSEDVFNTMGARLMYMHVK